MGKVRNADGRQYLCKKCGSEVKRVCVTMWRCSKPTCIHGAAFESDFLHPIPPWVKPGDSD